MIEFSLSQLTDEELDVVLSEALRLVKADSVEWCQWAWQCIVEYRVRHQNRSPA